MEIVTSLDHLKTLSNINGFAEFYIILGGGFARSSKQITYYEDSKTFNVYNEIDDTWQEDITEETLFIETLIPKAIERQALIYTGFQLNGI